MPSTTMNLRVERRRSLSGCILLPELNKYGEHGYTKRAGKAIHGGGGGGASSQVWCALPSRFLQCRAICLYRALAVRLGSLAVLHALEGGCPQRSADREDRRHGLRAVVCLGEAPRPRRACTRARRRAQRRAARGAESGDDQKRGLKMPLILRSIPQLPPLPRWCGSPCCRRGRCGSTCRPRSSESQNRVAPSLTAFPCVAPCRVPNTMVKRDSAGFRNGTTRRSQYDRRISKIGVAVSRARSNMCAAATHSGRGSWAERYGRMPC